MKRKTFYKCKACGNITSGYFGKCQNCGEWNSLEEVVEEIKQNKSEHLQQKTTAKPLLEVQLSGSQRIFTGIEEFNRVMGGGIVKDSVSIITAKPGAGKSTLLLQVASDLAKKGLKVLYASGEESESQIKSRANRILDEIPENLMVYSTNIMDYCINEIERIDPDFIIIDSIQTFVLKDIPSRPATPTQVMECAHKMVEIAKGERPRMVFMVGQMTKEDELAGVRALEHLVDTVLLLESDSNEQLRSLVSTKNRYGSTGEMGFFIMDEKGLVSLDNPSEFFMTERKKGEELPGSALAVVREGTRPIILEIEALASNSFLPYPSRISECMRREHLNTLISILEQRAGMKLVDKNVVIKTTGGIKLKETASNLAVMMSIFSSLKDVAIDTSTIFIADVGLTGELKGVPNLDERLREAERMGFERAFIAPVKHKNVNLEVIECNTLIDVIKYFQK